MILACTNVEEIRALVFMIIFYSTCIASTQHQAVVIFGDEKSADILNIIPRSTNARHDGASAKPHCIQLERP
jgi:hypothetical protein